MRRKKTSAIREWPDLHIRIEWEDYRLLEKLAEKDSRTMGQQARHLLKMAILSQAIGKGVNRG